MAVKSSQFFLQGTSKQFEFVLNKYQDALQAKADAKNSKAEVLLRLDKWYQNELPKKIKSRGKEGHLTHEELVQLIKWKLARGKFRPRLKDLIQMNTPRVVMQETKKAFRAIDKRKDIEAAVSALSNLKGVGPAMASAVLSAMAPELAPFMADECLLSMPEVEGIDYTMKEYMKLVEKTNECVDRLNAQGGDWTPHKVEMAIWTYYVLRENKPELLDALPEPGADADRRVVPENGGVGAAENGSKTETTNGVETSEPSLSNGEESEESNGSNPDTENSSESASNMSQETSSAPAPVENGVNPAAANESSVFSSQDSESTNQSSDESSKRSLEQDASDEAPSSKKVCTEEETAKELSKEVSEEFGQEVSKAESEAPNGVNNTPHQITSGGD